MAEFTSFTNDTLPVRPVAPAQAQDMAASVQMNNVQSAVMQKTVAQNAVEQVTEPVQETKPYTLRTLCADDLFPMARIISKIGIDRFRDAFNQNDIKALIKSLNKQEGADDSDNAPVSDDVVTSVGMSVVLSMAQVVLSHISDCRTDIYTFLGGVSGMKPEAIATLPIEVFAEMVVDVIQKPEFENFIKVVSKLLK
jgi:hypothetical protein